MKDYKNYYNLERYIFSKVKSNFQKNHFLSAEDFFCIIIWKANRSKSNIAKKLKKIFPERTLSDIVKLLTKGIYDIKLPRDKLKYYNYVKGKDRKHKQLIGKIGGGKI